MSRVFCCQEPEFFVAVKSLVTIGACLLMQCGTAFAAACCAAKRERARCNTRSCARDIPISSSSKGRRYCDSTIGGGRHARLRSFISPSAYRRHSSAELPHAKMPMSMQYPEIRAAQTRLYRAHLSWHIAHPRRQNRHGIRTCLPRTIRRTH